MCVRMGKMNLKHRDGLSVEVQQRNYAVGISV